MLSKIKIINIACIIALCLFCLPADLMAQRFGHGGGGGGRGGGGFHGGGGRAAAPAPRTINGGSRVGGHDFRAPIARPTYRVAPGFRGEGVFHPGYGLHPYFYHPFHPYIWGPYWHPFGFFVNSLAAGAFYFSLGGVGYYYDQGVYYVPSGGGYSVVAPPIGAVVNYLPTGYLTVPVGDATYYYYGGAFYVSQGGSFVVVSAPVGAIVTQLPEGAVEQTINGQTYLLYNNTYYEPISIDGQDAYEVVQVQ